MFGNMQNDGVRAKRIVTAPNGEVFAVGTDGKEWLAYSNDDYANATGLVALIGDTESEVIDAVHNER